MASSAPSSSKPAGSSTEPCPEPKASILVQVQRKDTKEFIGGASVKLEGPTPGSGETSPSTGTKLFEEVKPGSYKGTVTLSGKQAQDFEAPHFPSFKLRGGENKVVIVEVKRIAHWISFVLVDEEQQPVAGERYQVKLPDGTTREGKLDSAGRVRFDGIDRGKCEITFPDLDKDTWEAVGG
jgi:hypothetical protein